MFIILNNLIKPDLDKILSIINIPILNTKKQLLTFIVFATYYCDYIFKFAEITNPL